MGAPGRSPERSQAVPFVAEETSQEKLLAHSRILHVEKRIGITFDFREDVGNFEIQELMKKPGCEAFLLRV